MRTQPSVGRAPRRFIAAGALGATLMGIATLMALSGCASTRLVDADAALPAGAEPAAPAATADVSALRPHERRRVLRGS